MNLELNPCPWFATEAFYSLTPSPGCSVDLLIQFILPFLFLPPHVPLLSCVHLIGEGSRCLHDHSFSTFPPYFPSIPFCSVSHMQVTNVCWKGQRLSQLKPSACLSSRVLQFVYQPRVILAHWWEIVISPANIRLHCMILWYTVCVLVYLRLCCCACNLSQLLTC